MEAHKISVKNNSCHLPDINKLSQEELNKKIEKGLNGIEKKEKQSLPRKYFLTFELKWEKKKTAEGY